MFQHFSTDLDETEAQAVDKTAVEELVERLEDIGDSPLGDYVPIYGKDEGCTLHREIIPHTQAKA